MTIYILSTLYHFEQGQLGTALPILSTASRNVSSVYLQQVHTQTTLQSV